MLGFNFLYLHGKIRAEYLEHLLVSLVEADMLVLPLNDARLALNHEQELVFFEHHRLHKMCLVLEAILDLFKLSEARLGNLL